MEDKKKSKKTATNKEKVEKKINKKELLKKKKKAFTLIELLAVIIILGILMIIAIPSVTSYINNSRKSAYIDTAKEIISGARNLVNEGKLEMFDTETTYYIPTSCISTENGQKSPYGEFDKAYVLVTYNGQGYNYYWVSRDETGQGVKDPIAVEELDEEDIESDIAFDYIKEDKPQDGKSKIKIIDENDCKNISFAKYPKGKTKQTVVVGDIVTIGTEEFYVVSNDGTDLVLLARYNLKVGGIYNVSGASKIRDYTSSDEGYGIQSSDIKGYTGESVIYGVLSFSYSPYWDGKVGTNYLGSYCNKGTYTEGTNCAYVYDSNSNLFQYVDDYRKYLEDNLGASIKEARLMRFEEAIAFIDAGKTEELYSTSFRLGSASTSSSIWSVMFEDNIGSNVYRDLAFGVRPVIVI